MYNKIGLEEHFAIPETMGGSTVYFEKTGAKDIRSTRLLDLEAVSYTHLGSCWRVSGLGITVR